MVSIEDLLRIMRRDAVMRKAIDPSAPDPDQSMARLEDLARRYPPIQEADGYDFMPMIRGAAVEYGLDPQVLARGFRDAADAVQTERSAALEEANEILRGGK